MSAAVQIDRLYKSYGDLEAVKGIELEVQPGEIFGLIGPDGAGKTSTFHVVGGIMEPTRGSVRLFGRQSRDARADVGYLTQAFSLYADLSVNENIRYIGELRGIPGERIEERGQRYLKIFGMDRFTERLAGRLSGGMKQKLALVCALVSAPRLLLLDEPTTGVDPVSRREFWDALASLSENGVTILVATPYLDEAERCHRVALMHEGKIIKQGAPHELREQLGLARLEVFATNLSKAEDLLSASSSDLADVQRFGDRLDVMVADVGVGETRVRRILSENALSVSRIESGQPTLENVFVASLNAAGVHLDAKPYPRTGRESDPDEIAIGAYGLTRRFGDFLAVDQVDIEIRYGEIYGLLGANGAGKTTTIKMLCGLLPASEGRTILAGVEGTTRSPEVREQVGYMSQRFSLYDDLTIEGNLQFFAGVYGVPKSERKSRQDWVLQFSGLSGQSKRLTGSLPGGWKQRVAFGSALMHDPRVVFLDEPTSGVDPIARRAFWKIINALSDQGVAVLVTTHYLEEAEQCNRLGMMVAGRLVAQGTPTEIKKNQPGQLFDFAANLPLAALRLLKDRLDNWRVSLFGSRLHVILDREEEFAGIRELLSSSGITVEDVRKPGYSLEDAFIAIVEQERLQGRVGSDD